MRRWQRRWRRHLGVAPVYFSQVVVTLPDVIAAAIQIKRDEPCLCHHQDLRRWGDHHIVVLLPTVEDAVEHIVGEPGQQQGFHPSRQPVDAVAEAAE